MRETARKRGVTGAAAPKPPMLDASARFLASVIQSLDDAVITETLDGIITSWNPAAERIFGYSEKEAVGQPMTIIGPLDRQEEFGEIIGTVKGGERVERYETERRRKDGTTVDVSVTVSPVRDDEGKLIGISCIDRDITALKEASRNAYVTDENMRFLAAIVQSSEDAIISEALDGTITSWNPAAERLFGYTEKEALGQPMTIIAPPDRTAELRQIIERAKQGLTLERYETQRQRKNGTIVDVLVTVSLVRDQEGRLIGLSALDRDVTAQKQASQYARSLIEASLDPLVTISADGKITDVNEATINVTGVTAAGTYRHGLRQLLHRAGKGPRRLPAGARPGLRHGLPADHPPPGRPPDRRPLQRHGVQGRRRQRPRRFRRRP